MFRGITIIGNRKLKKFEMLKINAFYNKLRLIV